MSQIFPYNDVMGSLNLTPFTCNLIRALLPVTRVHSQLTPLYDPLINLWGTMRVCSEGLLFLVTLNDICFPIPPSQIWILPKPWFPIMGVDPTYPNYATDNIFSNPLQSIRGQLIWFPFYLSNNLYRVGRRHNFSKHHLTQQGYFPVQAFKRWVRTK